MEGSQSMSWIKLDDQFSTNDKVLAAGKDARELHISALCHCGRNLTDGFVDSRMVRQLAAMFEVYDWQEAVESLLDVGLWIAAPGGYQINNYLEFNPPRAKVEAQHEARAERQARWRAEHRRDDGTFRDDDDDEEPDEDVDATVTHNVTRYETRDRQPLPVPVPVPVPVPHPVPVPDPVPVVEEATTTADPITAQFYRGLDSMGVNIVSQAQGDAFNAIVDDIRSVADPPAFIEQLMTEAAATTSGRITPRWFEAVVDRCIREGRMPGDKRQVKGRDGPSNGSTEHSIDEWAAIAAQFNGGRT
jgi:hypothetical protein